MKSSGKTDKLVLFPPPNQIWNSNTKDDSKSLLSTVQEDLIKALPEVDAPISRSKICFAVQTEIPRERSVPTSHCFGQPSNISGPKLDLQGLNKTRKNPHGSAHGRLQFRLEGCLCVLLGLPSGFLRFLDSKKDLSEESNPTEARDHGRRFRDETRSGRGRVHRVEEEYPIPLRSRFFSPSRVAFFDCPLGSIFAKPLRGRPIFFLSTNLSSVPIPAVA
ncbi:hypothetical protein CRYUN_Cryun04dG0030800 [Craigia yunnanensis]